MFVAVDKNKMVVAVASQNHIAAPEGGEIREVSEQEAADYLAALSKPRPAVKDGPPPVTAASLKQLRKDKMWQIANSSVNSRGRVFNAFPHTHLMDQHRHIDLLVMFMRGKLKAEDTVLTRHLKTGEYENVSVETLLEEIEKTFWLRQDLRKHDQKYRDQVNAVYHDKLKSDEQKFAEITAIRVPEFLGVDEKRSAVSLVLKG
jgi:hypothetical protein